MRSFSKGGAPRGSLIATGSHRVPRIWLSFPAIAALIYTILFSPATRTLSVAAALPAQETVSIVMPAFLDTNLDSKKRNTGDQVEAKTAAQIELPDRTVIPRDAKVIGHITDSKARSKGDVQSSLTIVFEKVILPQGKILDVKGSLQAVAPNPNGEQSGEAVNYGTSIDRALQHAGPGQTTVNGVPILNGQSAGAYGIKDLALDSQGVLISSGKSVKLDHGSQLLLKLQVISH